MQRPIRFDDKSRVRRIRLLTYYFQRAITSRRVRRVGKHIIRQALGRARLAKFTTLNDTTVVEAFREHGILRSGQVQSPN